MLLIDSITGPEGENGTPSSNKYFFCIQLVARFFSIILLGFWELKDTWLIILGIKYQTNAFMPTKRHFYTTQYVQNDGCNQKIIVA